MSVESEILRIQRNIANAYAAVSEMGGEVPLQPTSANLPAAISTIPSGGSGGGVPVGTIVIWSGTTSNIPSGWALCNGQNGTPDLRDRFVLGGGGTYSVRSTGGEATHKLTVAEMPSHNHAVNYFHQTGSGSNKGVFSGSYEGTPYNTNSTGGSNPHNNMPPYYTLCYIQYIGDTTTQQT